MCQHMLNRSSRRREREREGDKKLFEEILTEKLPKPKEENRYAGISSTEGNK